MNVNAFWKAILAQDADKIRAYFHPDAYVNWHCTNEHFTVEEFIRANCEYPGNWDGVVERIVTACDIVITATHVYPKDRTASFHVTSFIKLKDDLIVSMDEYWADDGDAPQWRQEMKIGSKIQG
ncbi:MAG: nuclear transport factor 2 family protein [Clostridia bacterium]|nr:nuclear transport factor 2 family protein [Clostridia bacterium]